MTQDVLVRADQRGRISLGGIARPNEQYKVSADSLGRIILEPAVVLTATELALMNDEAFWGKVANSVRETHETFELDEL